MKIDLPVCKGMVFAGCSFTWGQGLYYYSNMPSLVESQPHDYDPKLVTHAHIEYMKTLRFPRLVANHFNTYELVHTHNGGSNSSAMDYWDDIFFQTSRGGYQNHNLTDSIKLDTSEVSLMVYQITQPHRDNFVIPSGELVSVFQFMSDAKYFDTYQSYLSDKNISETEFIKNYEQDSLKNIKQFLQKFENYGVKTMVLCWPSEMVPHLRNDSWMSDRWCKIDYQGSTFDSITDLMQINDQIHGRMTILSDTENFLVPPIDHHPSKQCHEIIAKSIIKHINEHNLV